MRLSAMLRDLRGEVTAEELARLSGISKLTISRLENGHKRPEVHQIMKLLGAMGIERGDPRYDLAIQLASESLERGWWDHPRYKGMDERAKVYADLEFGAASVCSYQTLLVPGYLQTEAFIEARGRVALENGLPFQPGSRDGRLRRQAELIRDAGPRIEVIVEETVIRRSVAPSDVMADQLEHFLQVVEQFPQVTVRVLPADCDLSDVLLPGSPFDLFSFEDPDDGRAILINTVVQDTLHRRSEEVAPYLRLFERLRDAAHSPGKSTSLIREHAAIFRGR